MEWGQDEEDAYHGCLDRICGGGYITNGKGDFGSGKSRSRGGVCAVQQLGKGETLDGVLLLVLGYRACTFSLWFLSSFFHGRGTKYILGKR